MTMAAPQANDKPANSGFDTQLFTLHFVCLLFAPLFMTSTIRKRAFPAIIFA